MKKAYIEKKLPKKHWWNIAGTRYEEVVILGKNIQEVGDINHPQKGIFYLVLTRDGEILEKSESRVFLKD